MTINITNVSALAELTPQGVVQFCNKNSAIPALVLLFLLTHLTFILVGVAMTQNKYRFFMIWGATLLISSLIFAAIMISPNIVQNIANFFS